MKFTSTILTIVATGCLIGSVGCKQQSTTTTSSTTAGESAADDHGHSHGEGGHSHAGGHGAGPNEGTLADWGGGKFHVEFTVDHDKQEATIYILGADEKTPSPIDAEAIDLSIAEPAMQVTLTAVPLESDPSGTSSRFVGNHESLGVVQEYAGTITGVVDGTPYAADFQEEAHAGHGHSHSGDDALVWEGDPIEHDGMLILLGHHGTHLHAGEEVEPAVSITRDGKPVSDAKVFNTLVDAVGQKVLAEEVGTTYEPTTEEEPAHYAQGGLMIPSGVSKVMIRFRIVPAGGQEMTFDVPVTVE